MDAWNELFINPDPSTLLGPLSGGCEFLFWAEDKGMHC